MTTKNKLIFFVSVSVLLFLFTNLAIAADEEGAKIDGADDSKKNILDTVAKVDDVSGNITIMNLTKVDPAAKMEVTNSEAKEKRDSLSIFFILTIIVVSCLLVHCLITMECRIIPESLAIVLLGAFIGLCFSFSRYDWSEVESFNPNFFFLILLPPIIFESGYNLHKGNFFSNTVPILTFSIIGTAISAVVIGLSLWFLGKCYLSYNLTFVEAFAFGSMISSVDPVATLAIFQSLKVDPQLYMLVFGESMMNDAVSIVLTSTTLEMHEAEKAGFTVVETFNYALSRFMQMFFVSALLGSIIGLVSALLFKHIDLRRTPSLEFALLLVFSYLPYGLAEALSLSGIMAILFCAITMSQYTHFNISPITQITMQQTFRTLSFVSETCTFAYLGMALFTFKLEFRFMFIFWSILLLFVSRACNIFPLSRLLNKFRRQKISFKNQVIMWFSGMRGAVAFALALHMEIESSETKRVILTTTLCLLLFTIAFMGGSALPAMKFINEYFPNENSCLPSRETTNKLVKKRKSRRERNISRSGSRSRKTSPVLLSKTQEMSNFDTFDCTSDDTELLNRRSNTNSNFLTEFNAKVMKKIFVRKFTLQERMENKERFRNLAIQALKSFADERDDEGGGSDNEVDNDYLFSTGDSQGPSNAPSLNV
uniref:Sodium/hydrogen exchanger n=1 Tax=Rhabditophanes sp. KR3021 TaxID=114890 RepID=A0AC35UDA3_9BILA